MPIIFGHKTHLLHTKQARKFMINLPVISAIKTVLKHYVRE